ncbi:MAG: aspartate carbamoyltransferase [bacterium]|nr:aspartate carbamoyltransferase [bacterium]
MNHLITTADYTIEDIASILKRAKLIKEKGYQITLKNKIIATLFFEPSTRTRLSFESAIHRAGGNVIGFSNAKSTSQSKGESLEDTIKMVSAYADAIVMRHPDAGSAARATTVSSVPIINGGDGANAHPTQTLVDLFAIQEILGQIKDFTITMVGDLTYSRVAHSLAQVLASYPGVKQIWVSPGELKMPDKIRDFLRTKSVQVTELSEYESVLSKTDIFLMTRVQEERFEDKSQYEKLKDNYILSLQQLKNAKASMKILSPLPRLYELPTSIDSTPFAYYFQQAADAVPVRAAILDYILNK